VLRDLESLRAVASPARLAILELLREQRVLTASRCAQMLSSTAKSCSYHLHVLERSGLVEQVSTGDRRERPWRLTYDIMETEPMGEEKFGEATDELIRVSVNHNYQALINFMQWRHQLSARWRQATTITSRVTMFTADELEEWAAKLEKSTRSQIARSAASAEPDRRRVRLIVYGFPDRQGPAESADADGANGSAIEV
jgi:DNA-binding transcriptional ArsR family regulator